jgi:hypothetical protein
VVDATHCIYPEYATSEVNVFVFRREGNALLPLAGASVTVRERTVRERPPLVSGTADDSGYVQLKAVAPGMYFLVVSGSEIDPSVHDLRITQKAQQVRVLGVADADLCPKSCVVAGSGVSALATLRTCLEKPGECGDHPSRPTSGCS